MASTRRTVPAPRFQPVPLVPFQLCLELDPKDAMVPLLPSQLRPELDPKDAMVPLVPFRPCPELDPKDAMALCGVVNLKDYFERAVRKNDTKDGNVLVQKTALPTRKLGLKATDEGCSILSSWLNCIIKNLALGRSWDGKFDLTFFVVVDGAVHTLVEPHCRQALSGHRKNDCKILADYIKRMFAFDGELPPYFNHLIRLLENLPFGPLMHSYRLALETHCSLITPKSRICLMHLLKIMYDSLGHSARNKFLDALHNCKIRGKWYSDIFHIKILRNVAVWGEEDGKTSYNETKMSSAFFFIRNYCTHVSKNCVKDGTIFNDGMELMIPETFGDFVPDMMVKLLARDLNVEEWVKNCLPSPLQVAQSQVKVLAPCCEGQEECANNCPLQGQRLHGRLNEYNVLENEKEKRVLSENDADMAARIEHLEQQLQLEQAKNKKLEHDLQMERERRPITKGSEVKVCPKGSSNRGC